MGASECSFAVLSMWYVQCHSSTWCREKNTALHQLGNQSPACGCTAALGCILAHVSALLLLQQSSHSCLGALGYRCCQRAALVLRPGESITFEAQAAFSSCLFAILYRGLHA